MASPANFNLFTSTVKWIPRNYRDPYVQSYYVGFQASVGKNRNVDIAYVGNHSLKLQEIGTFNQRNPALGMDPVTGNFWPSDRYCFAIDYRHFDVTNFAALQNQLRITSGVTWSSGTGRLWPF